MSDDDDDMPDETYDPNFIEYELALSSVASAVSRLEELHYRYPTLRFTDHQLYIAELQERLARLGRARAA